MGNRDDTFWKLLEPEYLKGMMFCRKLMGDRDNGDDLYQDALVLAFTRFDDLNDRSAFRSWFYRILINRFNSAVRRPWWKRRTRLTQDMEQNIRGENPNGLYTARRWLERAFRAVSAKQQALVTLHGMEGWSIGELAELYGATEGSIKASLFRARRKMKKALIRITRQRDLLANKKPILPEDLRCDAAKSAIE